ncbi:hypothetical protein PFISCL1PPCAC_27477, partial [Pristionchus fissidentatus]
VIRVLFQRSSSKLLKKSQIRAAKSMVALTAAYLMSWFFTSAFAFVSTVVPPDSILAKINNQYAVFLALISYSSTYYSHFVISREFRREFMESFCCRPFKRLCYGNTSANTSFM